MTLVILLKTRIFQSEEREREKRGEGEARQWRGNEFTGWLAN